jgi:MOSC domain-containing protein YiiM
MASIKSIVYKPGDEPEDRSVVGFLRRPLDAAMLVEGYGIQGDHKGGHPKRHLNVMDEVTLAELKAEGYPTGAGKLGENIILSGIDLRPLPDGTQLRLGSQAVIVLGKPRVPCERLTPLDARMPASVEERVGRMCRVIKSGSIKVGDAIEVLVEAKAQSG